MSKEKKKTIILTVVLAIIALALIAVLVVNQLEQNGDITSSEVKEIMKDFNKYYNSKETTVIYYASSTCGWCELETPILETISEDYDMDYLYIDSSKLPKKQREEVLEKLGIEHSTPTTVIVEEGKVVDTAIGYQDPADYIEFFSSNDLIPEDAVYSKEDSLTIVDYEGYTNLINSPGAHIIVIGQTTCSHCIAIKPALNTVAKDYNITINYINVNILTQDEYNGFSESLKKLEYNDPDFVEKGSFGTPLVLMVRDGKIFKYFAGERTISQLVREFKKAGFVSE